VLIVSVQCAYHAHVYLSNKDPEYEKGLRWARRTRQFYDVGLFALLVGLALILVPHHDTDVQADFRWAAFALACAAGVGEVIWVIVDPWLRSERKGIYWIGRTKLNESDGSQG
jgi:hypothetical protein